MDTLQCKNSNERHLKNKWLTLKNRREELSKTKCRELNHIPTDFNLSHTDCQFIRNSYEDYCRQSCDYYKNEILPIEEEMQAIRQSDIG